MRIDCALLIGAGYITGEQSGLIADAEVAVGELIHCHRAAYEVCAVAGLRRLENQVFESNGVVIAHHPLMFARQHQLELDARQFDERTFGLGRRNREAAIEVRDEVLLEVAIGGVVIGNAVMSEFLRRSPRRVPKARSPRPRACGERARI